MAKEEKAAKAAEEEKAAKVDVFSRGAGMTLKLPTSHTRAFLAKAEHFNIKGRKNGPCVVAIKFMLPNGDIILKDDTFDPVEERMSLGMFRSLLHRKYFTCGSKKAEVSWQTKLQKSEVTK